MRFSNIEVTGIVNIVFDRKVQWEFEIETSTWCHSKKEKTMYHEDMMKIVNLLKTDRRYRMWVHLDTLNIVRKNERPEKMPTLSSLITRTIERNPFSPTYNPSV